MLHIIYTYIYYILYIYTTARDLAVMKRSAYRLISKELTVQEFRVHAEMYIKQGTIYFSMLTDG